MTCSFKSFAGRLRILRFSYRVHFHPPLWFVSRCRASTKRYMLHCHQCSDDTQLSISFPPDPDTAAGNLKQCLAEISFWKKASWLLLNLDKAEIMLISWGECFEDPVKFITARSVDGIYLASSLSGGQCKHQVRISFPHKLTKTLTYYFLDACFILKDLITFPLSLTVKPTPGA
ncbi:hypothetical protein WISP_79074 [Willisornis vidua]|uniref:Uncharacterized protein n=1 Tax=Willisornis vidua TaxID=1566151 RepID=A0ABQ9D5B6_9PASS|nr:hypothetical protein WISP_79074 [Willisornis vidua]